MSYKKYELYMTDGQHKSLASAINNGQPINIRFNASMLKNKPNTDLMLTAAQIKKLDNAKSAGRGAQLSMSKTQIQSQRKALKGGVLPLLASVGLPVLAGVLTNILSKGITGDGIPDPNRDYLVEQSSSTSGDPSLPPMMVPTKDMGHGIKQSMIVAPKAHNVSGFGLSLPGQGLSLPGSSGKGIEEELATVISSLQNIMSALTPAQQQQQQTVQQQQQQAIDVIQQAMQQAQQSQQQQSGDIYERQEEIITQQAQQRQQKTQQQQMLQQASEEIRQMSQQQEMRQAQQVLDFSGLVPQQQVIQQTQVDSPGIEEGVGIFLPGTKNFARSKSTIKMDPARAGSKKKKTVQRRQQKPAKQSTAQVRMEQVRI